jgi:hypothetical protein
MTEWTVQGNYGQGWEDLTACESRQEAIEERDNYNANEPAIPHRVHSRRVAVPSSKKDRETLDEIAQMIEEKTGTDPIDYISHPTETTQRIVFADGVVSLTYAEAVIHAASIVTKL